MLEGGEAVILNAPSGGAPGRARFGR